MDGFSLVADGVWGLNGSVCDCGVRHPCSHGMHQHDCATTMRAVDLMEEVVSDGEDGAAASAHSAPRKRKEKA